MEEVMVGKPELSPGTRKRKSYWEMMGESSFPEPLVHSSISLDIEEERTSLREVKEAKEVMEESSFSQSPIRSATSSDIEKETSPVDLEESSFRSLIHSTVLSTIKKEISLWKSEVAEEVMEESSFSQPLIRSAISSDIEKRTLLGESEEVKKENSSSSFLPVALPSNTEEQMYQIEDDLPQQTKKAYTLDQVFLVSTNAATYLRDEVLIEPIHQQNEDLASIKVCSGPSYEHQPPLTPSKWQDLESSEDAREVETPQLMHIGGLFSLFIPYPSRIEAPKTSQVLKSMVSSGLTESITSLTILTAAVNANISNGNMIALALTNLISGIFLIRHDLAGLEKNTRKRGQPKGYIEVLVDGLHYLLHYTMALLSFVFFGLVPPLVYGFAFQETYDKDLKIAAVAGASLLCITLLALARTHVQKPESWQVYVKNVGHYVLLGVGALALAYLAGNLFGKLIGKFGWFE